MKEGRDKGLRAPKLVHSVARRQPLHREAQRVVKHRLAVLLLGRLRVVGGQHVVADLAVLDLYIVLSLRHAKSFGRWRLRTAA